MSPRPKKNRISLSVFVDESSVNLENKDYVLLGVICLETKETEKLFDAYKTANSRKKVDDLPELHYKDLDNFYKYDETKKTTKLSLAKGAISLFKKIRKLKRFVFFAIIDKAKIERDFGHGPERDKNIQKKFIRLGILNAIHRFVYKYKLALVENIMVDKGSPAEDGYFIKYCTKKIESKTKAVLPEKIRFLDSDHRKVSNGDKRYSFCLQVTDLFLGAYKNTIAEVKAGKAKLEFTKYMEDYVITFERRSSDEGRIGYYPKICKKVLSKHKFIDGSSRVAEIVSTKYSVDKSIMKAARPKGIGGLNAE